MRLGEGLAELPGPAAGLALDGGGTAVGPAVVDVDELAPAGVLRLAGESRGVLLQMGDHMTARPVRQRGGGPDVVIGEAGEQVLQAALAVADASHKIVRCHGKQVTG
nr:hypothetical protein GCM10020093_110180 [Planobispora longispora]